MMSSRPAKLRLWRNGRDDFIIFKKRSVGGRIDRNWSSASRYRIRPFKKPSVKIHRRFAGELLAIIEPGDGVPKQLRPLQPRRLVERRWVRRFFRRDRDLPKEDLAGRRLPSIKRLPKPVHLDRRRIRAPKRARLDDSWRLKRQDRTSRDAARTWRSRNIGNDDEASARKFPPPEPPPPEPPPYPALALPP